jgi:hypothetical protein
VQEEFRRWFLERGEVEMYASRRTAGWGMLGIGVAFALAGVFLLSIPAGASSRPPALLNLGGTLGLLMGVAGLAFGVWVLVRPMRLLRMDRDGLTTYHAPFAHWHEVQGARIERAGITVAWIRYAPSFWERIAEEEPRRARRLGVRPDGSRRREEVVVPGGAPGGGETVRDLVLWAKQQVEQPR